MYSALTSTQDAFADLCGDARYVEVLARRRSKLVGRWHPPIGDSVIIKAWSGESKTSWLLRELHMDWTWREWRALKSLYGSAVCVPQPLGLFRLNPTHRPFHTALVMEDIKDCPSLLSRLTQFVQNRDDSEISRVTENFVQMAVHLLEAGFIDPDHGVHNIMMRGDETLVRFDLESAKKVRSVNKHTDRYGRMLGRMLGSYALAVQPHFEYVCKLSAIMNVNLHPSPDAQTVAESFLNQCLRKCESSTAMNLTRTELWK